jgi:hypothetical protein
MGLNSLDTNGIRSKRTEELRSPAIVARLVQR